MPHYKTQIYKGHIIDTPTMEQYRIYENGYIVVEDGKVVDVFATLPEAYLDIPVSNYGDNIIIPGFNDLHIHAPQFPNRGLCLDEPLMEWLFDCTFPLEAKFIDLEFAKKVYRVLIKELWKVGNLRSLIYNTIHYDATLLLFDMLVQSGLGGYIGKVNMDIESPEYLRESTKQSLLETEQFIIETLYKSDLVKPIIAPRFVPSCSPELLTGLGQLAQKYQVPVMSHLSEELNEIKIVKQMYPSFPTYGSIYNYFGLFGQTPTVMAHCIYSNKEERALMKKNGVWAAHCPSSNLNLGSGLMPVRIFLNEGIKVGLGSDVAGGGTLSMFPSIIDAISTSKLVWLFSGKMLTPLSSSEAFYMATKGSGSFFGNVGSFEPGNDFDALVIDDHDILQLDYNLQERIERLLYVGSHENIIARFVQGRNLPEPIFD
jgi:guanine deaminase